MSDPVSEPRYQFHSSYEETVYLRDGARVVLRAIRPSDKQLLLEGFERLSPESRYLRFLAPKSTLSDRELRYLTEVDGEGHFALVALRKPPLGKAEGIAVGRFVRLTEDRETAEPAITVADDYQGKGLGSILLHRLLEAAWERGIRQFRCQVLARNVRLRELLAEVGTDVRVEGVGEGALVVTVPIEAPLPGERRPLRPSLRRILSSVAQELVAVVPALARPPEDRSR